MPSNSFVCARVYVCACACVHVGGGGETTTREKRRPEVMAAHLDFVLFPTPCCTVYL